MDKYECIIESTGEVDFQNFTLNDVIHYMSEVNASPELEWSKGMSYKFKNCEHIYRWRKTGTEMEATCRGMKCYVNGRWHGCGKCSACKKAMKAQGIKHGMVTPRMIDAGSAIANDIMDSSLQMELGGADEEEINKNFADRENLDLIKEYLAGDIDSVTAIYLAMERQRKADAKE